MKRIIILSIMLLGIKSYALVYDISGKLNMSNLAAYNVVNNWLEAKSSSSWARDSIFTYIIDASSSSKYQISFKLKYQRSSMQAEIRAWVMDKISTYSSYIKTGSYISIHNCTHDDDGHCEPCEPNILWSK